MGNVCGSRKSIKTIKPNPIKTKAKAKNKQLNDSSDEDDYHKPSLQLQKTETFKPTSINDFICGKSYGKGFFSEVFNGLNSRTGEIVAIKKIDLQKVLKTGFLCES